MPGWFNKEEKSETATTPQPQAFETGKEIQFKDQKSGETIYQRALSADHRKEVMDAMQRNASCANQFMNVSRQRIVVEEAIAKANKAIADSEKEINDIITKVRDELKLDRRWGLNIQLGILERRDPPQ